MSKVPENRATLTAAVAGNELLSVQQPQMGAAQ